MTQKRARSTWRGVRFFLLMCTLETGLLFPAKLPADELPSPQGVIEIFLDTIRSMEFPIRDETRHTARVAQANSFLDLETMGKAALVEHWSTLAQNDRDTFFALLKKLIGEVAYAQSQSSLKNVEIVYPEARTEGSEAVVHSLIKNKEDSALDIPVVYHLSAIGAHWRIDDIILDDISIIEDLKYQWDKIIRNDSFAELLNLMQTRLSAAEKRNRSASA